MLWAPSSVWYLLEDQLSQGGVGRFPFLLEPLELVLSNSRVCWASIMRMIMVRPTADARAFTLQCLIKRPSAVRGVEGGLEAKEGQTCIGPELGLHLECPILPGLGICKAASDPETLGESEWLR